MEEAGLAEVTNPSQLFLAQRSSARGGAVVTASIEGTRPLLVEIQSLVTASNYATPRRTSAGIDLNRVALIMAVLEKHAGVSFLGLDTFVNVVGGVRPDRDSGRPGPGDQPGLQFKRKELVRRYPDRRRGRFNR